VLAQHASDEENGEIEEPKQTQKLVAGKIKIEWPSRGKQNSGNHRDSYENLS
jgi:hypothetical protein